MPCFFCVCVCFLGGGWGGGKDVIGICHSITPKGSLVEWQWGNFCLLTIAQHFRMFHEIVVGYWWNRINFIQIMASKGFIIRFVSYLHRGRLVHRDCTARSWWKAKGGGGGDYSMWVGYWLRYSRITQRMHGHVVKHYDKKRVSQPALRTFLLDLYPRQVSGSPQHRTWEIKIPFDASMSVRLLPKWIKWACTDGLFHVSCSFQILGTKMPKKKQKYDLHLGERGFHCFILKSEVLQGLKIC